MFNLMRKRREGRGEGALARRVYTPFDLLRREFASVFDRAFGGWPALFTEPPEMPEPWGLRMEEGDKEIVVRAEVPGFAPEEIEVTLRDNVLTVRAEHREAAKEGEAEDRSATLEGAVLLPPGIVPEGIEARCRNGMLEVRVPRAPEALPRRIEVKT